MVYLVPLPAPQMLPNQQTWSAVPCAAACSHRPALAERIEPSPAFWLYEEGIACCWLPPSSAAWWDSCAGDWAGWSCAGHGNSPSHCYLSKRGEEMSATHVLHKSFNPPIKKMLNNCSLVLVLTHSPTPPKGRALTVKWTRQSLARRAPLEVSAITLLISWQSDKKTLSHNHTKHCGYNLTSFIATTSIQC